VGALGKHHLKWLHEIPGSDLVGVYDIDTEKATRSAHEYGITAFGSLQDLAEAVEAAAVVVPTTAHCEVASLLINHGIHCLIEKPVAATMRDAETLARLTAEGNLKVTVGHIERFNPAVQGLQGLDVRPSFIEAHRLAAFDPRGADVAVVLDLMIHDIDLVLSLVGAEVADIQASAVAVVSEQADIANARLTFENGAVANLTASRISLHALRKMRLFQKSGYYSLDLARKEADIYRLADEGADEEGLRVPLGKSGRELLYLKKTDSGEDMLRAELENFLEAILQDRPVAVPLQEAMAALDVALRIERIGRQSLARMLQGQSK
jgi:predicted dehydrogenase